MKSMDLMIVSIIKNKMWKIIHEQVSRNVKKKTKVHYWIISCFRCLLSFYIVQLILVTIEINHNAPANDTRLNQRFLINPTYPFPFRNMGRTLKNHYFWFLCKFVTITFIWLVLFKILIYFICAYLYFSFLSRKKNQLLIENIY